MVETENVVGAPDGKPSPARFNTGHYAELAALHGAVVGALTNELTLAMTRLSESRAREQDLALQVASLKKQCNEQELKIRTLKDKDES